MKLLKAFLKWGAIGFVALLLFIVLINVWVVRAASSRIYEEVSEVPEVPVAVLLGTSRHNGAGIPNVFFFHRIDAATALYHAGKIKKIIVSGDNGNTAYNETEDMRRELEARGVPAKDIVNDHAGFRTLDSVVRSKSVFGQDRIIVISQKFHVQRAIFIARAHGIEADGFVAKDPAHRAAYRKVMFREYFARVKAFLDCYLLGTEPRFPGPPAPITFD